jgi:RNA polymerase sigma-70 factor (ECF subfamily)
MSPVRNAADDTYLAGLMRAAQGGDDRSYTRLLNDIVPRLRRVIRKRRPFLQASDVEDLVQDVLLSLHAVRTSYDHERPFMPWLLAIAHNRMADGARRYARRAAHEVQVEQLPVTFAGDDANFGTNRYGDPEALRHAMACLPKGQRNAIEMLKLRELSLKETSVQTGASVGALKVSVHRGMAALRKALMKVQPQ